MIRLYLYQIPQSNFIFLVEILSPRQHLSRDPINIYFGIIRKSLYFQMQKQNIYIHSVENTVLFPYNEYKFAISATSYQPEQHENLVGFVTKVKQIDPNGIIEQIDGVSRYGTLLRIQRLDILSKAYSADKGKQPSVNYIGLTFARFKILALARHQTHFRATIEIFPDNITKDIQRTIQKRNLLQNLRKELKVYYECVKKISEAESSKTKLDEQTSINKIVNVAISQLDAPVDTKLKFLQMDDIISKMQLLIQLVREKTERSKGMISIQKKVKQQMLPKKRIAPITNALTVFGEKNHLMQKVNAKKLPEIVRAEIEKQMKNMGYGSDKSVTEKYIDTLLEIPWMETTQDLKNIQTAEKVLNQDHTGLKEVKERILEYLAVKFRNGNSKGNVICLHGPPGVGKTSIAKSIAKALGRSFTRVSLGGMNDEAQLRGHRRTYVASLPGVIIRALIKAKSNNPVILLDQIQKMGNSHKGNPEHALLEILDPSQNSSFIDNYVGLPVDLSKVMFICTANSLDLTGPLLNRLQLIQVPGYSRQEKLQIAKNHLIPLQVRENGVEGLVQFQNAGVEELIKYSSELGVRNLERAIGKVCRKIARRGRRELVTKEKVEEYLGKRTKNELWSGVGVVNGLAWTELGGKVLTVESLQYRNDKQKLRMTGQLGEVMKESVDIAFSWIRSNFEEMGLFGSSSRKILDQTSLHIHFPDGATKKDGPSAGVTIVACLSSILLKIPPRESLAMTGQITLSGKVLGVGGVREKCMAAIYQGIKHIIIPEANLGDLQKIDEQLRKQAQFYAVKEIKEVLLIAFPMLEKIAAKL